jgi:hypothetical protein
MNEMLENGSSGGAWPLPSSESHDEFLRLCALSTTESLSSEERSRLENHLSECAECREAAQQYQALIDEEIPAGCLSANSDSDWSLDEAEAALLARLELRDRAPEGAAGVSGSVSPRDPASPPARSQNVSMRRNALWRHIWLQWAAAMLLAAALGYSLFCAGMNEEAKTRGSGTSPATAHSKPVLDAPEEAAADSELAQTRTALQKQEARSAALDAQLRSQTTQIANLELRKAQAEAALRSAQANGENLERARDDLNRQLSASQTNLDETRQQLDDISAERAKDAVQVTGLSRQIDDLNSDLAQRNQELAREQALLDHDQDIRALMDSRDLYIAEVYDVAKTGRTEKPFGRVFYTKGKSLIFYAYDLDERPGVQDSSSFQAWGSRGPQRADAVNLGIFYQDSAARKCWILKADNPKMLSGIDAVFVTVEPHGGSEHPSGKSLLYAYLHIEPNHP